ncbi:MAG: TorD/DmsD family molecular chaperone [Candidatus Promineifilaceae bacterium]
MQYTENHQTALARDGAYNLLGQLFLEGVSAELLPYLAEIPELHIENFDADIAAAAHQNLFRFTLFPNASIFLDTSGLLGGDVSEAAGRLYGQAGIPSPDEPDSVGNLLQLIAFLCAAEAEAWEDDMPVIAKRIRARQKRILEAGLLKWMPPLVVSIRQQNNPFYTGVANLMWALLGEHYADLSDQPANLKWNLTPPPDLLHDDKTGLKDIALYVTTPALSGWWFGRGEVSRIGRKTDLPRGFGGRINMLMNLFRAASQFDSAETLFSGLTQLGTEWVNGYDELAADAPALQPIVAIWQARAKYTQELLQTMRDKIVSLE